MCLIYVITGHFESYFRQLRGTSPTSLCLQFHTVSFLHQLLTVICFCSQESLAFMFEMAHLHEDSLREYDELEICYLETGA